VTVFGKGILLAGFSEAVSNLLRMALQEAGYSTEILGDGQIGRLDGSTVGVLIVDVSARQATDFPGVQQAADLNIPIIALSNRDGEKPEAESPKSLPRPFRVSQLLDLISEVMGHQIA